MEINLKTLIGKLNDTTRTAASRAYSRATVEVPSPDVAETNWITRPRCAEAGPSAAHSPAISVVRSTIRIGYTLALKRSA